MVEQKGMITKYSKWWLFRAKFWPAWFWNMSKKAQSEMKLPDGDGKSIRFYPRKDKW